MTAQLTALADRPVIVGAGLAGMLVALALAPRPVVLVSAGRLGAGGSTPLAQGGLAAALGADDSLDAHLADTIAAGDGLVDVAAARAILSRAGDVVAALERHGVVFDREPDDDYARGLEAAHGCRRILHAGGDATGARIAAALAEAIRRTPSIMVLEEVEARAIVTHDDAVCGLAAMGPGGPLVLPASQLILATGGIGGLFSHATNPSTSIGLGLQLAARAGARLADLEFVQFHPTALDRPRQPLALISEAVRGEGACLVNASGNALMAGVPGGDLAPRDVVARAIAAEIGRGGQVFLDARAALGARFATRFPAISDLLAEEGIDSACDLIPVCPAAHYHMGGIATDRSGRTSLAGLWAIGEVAATGLHGANRLASNSLLEAGAMALAAAEAINGATTRLVRLPAAIAPLPAPDAARVRPILSQHLGVLRDAAGLDAAISALTPLALGNGASSGPATIGLMMAFAALERRESRGAHARTDFPAAMAAQRQTLTLAEVLARIGAAPLAQSPLPSARIA
jgi:L-aspartate oxidase